MMNDEIAVENGMHFELFLVDEINSKKSIHFNRVKMMLFLKQSLLSSMRKINFFMITT